MTNVSEWAVSAGLNNSAPPHGWPENMARSAVNDCAREMMGALARWFKDCNGSLVTGGTADNYTVTTNNGANALNDLPLMAIRADRANVGSSVTLNVDGLGAKALVKSGAGGLFNAGEIALNQLMIVGYNPTLDRFELVGPAPGPFGAATKMVFGNASAPAGWTKVLTDDNKALRLVTGGTGGAAGGTSPFTTVFAPRGITQPMLPNIDFVVTGTAANHNHGPGSLGGATGNDSPAHKHAITGPANTTSSANSGPDRTNIWQGTNNINTGNPDVSHTHSVNINTGLTSNSGALALSATAASGGTGTAMDFAVQYVDVILATKN
jgi:hypothetical protein